MSHNSKPIKISWLRKEIKSFKTVLQSFNIGSPASAYYQENTVPFVDEAGKSFGIMYTTIKVVDNAVTVYRLEQTLTFPDLIPSDNSISSITWSTVYIDLNNDGQIDINSFLTGEIISGTGVFLKSKGICVISSDKDIISVAIHLDEC